MTDQEEKDRHEREKALRAQRKSAEGKQSSAHHSRMYRYHDGMARVLSKAMKKSGNRELKRQYDFHVSRCSHHEKHLGEETLPKAKKFNGTSTSGKTKAKTSFGMANRDDDSDDA